MSIIKFAIFICCMFPRPALTEEAKTTGTISATVTDQESIEIKTQIEYAPVCKTGNVRDDCIHSIEAMAAQEALDRAAAQLNNLTPALGELK